MVISFKLGMLLSMLPWCSAQFASSFTLNLVQRAFSMVISSGRLFLLLSKLSGTSTTIGVSYVAPNLTIDFFVIRSSLPHGSTICAWSSISLAFSFGQWYFIFTASLPMDNYRTLPKVSSSTTTLLTFSGSKWSCLLLDAQSGSLSDSKVNSKTTMNSSETSWLSHRSRAKIEFLKLFLVI